MCHKRWWNVIVNHEMIQKSPCLITKKWFNTAILVLNFKSDIHKSFFYIILLLKYKLIYKFAIVALFWSFSKFLKLFSSFFHFFPPLFFSFPAFSVFLLPVEKTCQPCFKTWPFKGLINLINKIFLKTASEQIQWPKRKQERKVSVKAQ